MRVYLAGPMRGYPDCNFAAFDAAADRWRAAGHHPIAPTAMDRLLGYDALPDGSFGEVDSPERLAAVAFALLVAVSRAEAIALLRGWERSVGATMELAMAQFLKLGVYCGETLVPLALPRCPWSHLSPELIARGISPLESGDWGECWRKLVEGEGHATAGNPQGIGRSPTGDGIGARPRSPHVEGFVVVSPADGAPAAYCSRCSRWFGATVEQIQTLSSSGEVTLCRDCYDSAGNSVR